MSLLTFEEEEKYFVRKLFVFNKINHILIIINMIFIYVVLKEGKNLNF